MRSRSGGKLIAGMMGLLVIVMATGGCAARPGHQGVATNGIARRVTVFYATDRAVKSDAPGAVTYGWKRAYHDGEDPFQLGVCRVEIRRERNHDQPAPLPKSSSELVSLESTSVLDRTEFYARLRDLMWTADADETFVFVHGYNTDFEQAIQRTAELWYDVGFRGPPIMYSWPSRGGSFWRGLLGYFADSATMEWTASNLRQFLEQLVEETSGRRLASGEPARIHLIAHSMGCRALLGALVLISDDLRSGDRPIFCDVILAAPDVDRDVFRDSIAPRILGRPLAEHFTLYASGNDKALRTAMRLQVYPRAGIVGDVLVGEESAFDTIDVSEVIEDSKGIRHDYFVSQPAMLRDLIEILVHGNRRPGSPGRAMHRETSDESEAWVMVDEGAPD